jgi:hypothetical protein
MFRHTILVLFFVPALVIATLCDSANINSNSNASGKSTKTPKASPTPTPTDEERELARQKSKEGARAALEEYVSLNHPGWEVVGIAEMDSECVAGAICYVDIRKDNKSKVIAIVMREFYKQDGTTYWSVSTATQLDLLSGRLESLREAEKESVLAELTFSDCEEVFAAASYDQANYEYPDEHYERRPGY